MGKALEDFNHFTSLIILNTPINVGKSEIPTSRGEETLANGDKVFEQSIKYLQKAINENEVSSDTASQVRNNISLAKQKLEVHNIDIKADVINNYEKVMTQLAEISEDTLQP